MSELCERNYQILLETNGSIDITHVPYFVTSIVDVKCPSSGCCESFLLSNLSEIHKENDEIKFVLSDRRDYEWAVAFIKKHALSENKILFSCVHGKLEPTTLAEWIIQDKIIVRLQIQLHKLLWHPDKRGV
jgi:7-carboxy-7-deazaguanine synthase